jgi:hypothetical protein
VKYATLLDAANALWSTQRTCRNQHSPAGQRLLQFSDGAVRGRGTVGLFHAAKQRLQSRLFVPDHPPAREYLGLVETRYSDDLGGAGKTGIEITARGQGHPITSD